MKNYLKWSGVILISLAVVSEYMSLGQTSSAQLMYMQVATGIVGLFGAANAYLGFKK